MTTKIDNLPAPGAEAEACSRKLQRLISEKIAAEGGRISFADYMALALYSPGLGYYSAGLRKFGEAGDYVTAPEISPLFSQCVARQCRQILAVEGCREILEVGAGSGVMARDVLTELEAQDSLPDHYCILELSADLRQRQQSMLEQSVPHLVERIQWLDQLPAQGFRGVIIANEVLDAMPVHRLSLTRDASYELYVSDENDQLVWHCGEPVDVEVAKRAAEIRSLIGDAGEGYVTEVNLAAESWIGSIADIVEQGLVLIFDYGYPRKEYYHPERDAGTLKCFYRHRSHDDPLILCGLQDITAHVDFTAIAAAASEAGLDVAGFTTQANFLLSCGLADLVVETTDIRQQIVQAQQIKKLTLPAEMGEVVKVIALTRGIEHALGGFSMRDMRAYL